MRVLEKEKELMTVKAIITAVLILTVMLSMAAFSSPKGAPKEAKSRGGTFELMREIQTLNLMNNLYLKGDQAGKLVPLVREACEQDEAFEGALSDAEQSMGTVLVKMRDELAASGSLKKDTQRTFMEAERKVAQARFEVITAKKRLVGEVKSLLSENQQVLVKQYEPCLVPTQSQANPDRIGQAGGNSMLLRILEDAREAPEEEYPEFRERFLENTRRMITLHRPDLDVEEELERHGRILDEAREMSDEDFELKKSRMAEEFRKPGGPPAKGGARAGSADLLERNIEQFMLNRYALALLTKVAAGK